VSLLGHPLAGLMLAQSRMKVHALLVVHADILLRYRSASGSKGDVLLILLQMKVFSLTYLMF
jgi:hypothetical protein